MNNAPVPWTLPGPDRRLSLVDIDVLNAARKLQHPRTLDALAASMPSFPKENVFHAVGRLERFGHLPEGAIR